MTQEASEDPLALAGRQVELEWSPERSEHNLRRVHVRRARRRNLSMVVAASGVVAAAALLLLFVFGKHNSPAPPTPVAALASAQVTGVPSPKTTFIDGSVARVSEGGELQVRVATPSHIESVLASGAADFEVTKHPERNFVVLAGPVRVRVVGTHFRVERIGDRTRVAVTEGKVEVREGDDLTYLEAGESKFFPSIPEAAASTILADPEAHPNVLPSLHSRFVDLARSQKFRDAYQVMSQTPSVVSSSAEDLMLAADAARNTGHPEQAVGYLRRVTAEHKGDSRAPIAAFTLGTLMLNQLGHPAEAADAFSLVRRLSPHGNLAENALAREAEASQKAGLTPRAKALSQQYVARYPHGMYLPSMQRLATPE